MLRSVKDLEGYVVRASDGPIGHVKDFFFDDRSWVVRYLVVETGSWLKSRKVLISPVALRGPEWTARLLPVAITKEQVRNSPDVDTHLPVSRQHEVQYADYYGDPYYWESVRQGNVGSHQDPIAPRYDVIGSIQAKRAEHAEAIARTTSGSESDNPHLRSCRAVMRYLVHANDGNVGEVGGMLLDDAIWAIRYLVVSTGDWWGGHQVLIAPRWIDDVSWDEASVSVGLTRQAIKDAPDYDPTVSLERPAEESLFQHHGRPGYWTNEPIS